MANDEWTCSSRLADFERMMGMTNVSGAAKMARDIASQVDDEIAHKGYSKADLSHQVKGRIILDEILRELPKPRRLSHGYPPRGWNGLLMFVKAMVFTLEDFECIYCTLPTDSLDHVVPASDFGPYMDKVEAGSIMNLVASCRWCNTSKGRRSLESFLEKIKKENAVEYSVHISQAWIKRNRHYSELQKQSAEGLATFEKERLPVCKQLEQAFKERK